MMDLVFVLGSWHMAAAEFDGAEAKVMGGCPLGKGVTGMKRIAIFFMAVVLVAASTSFAFAACAGHTKAQLVKSDPREQVSQEQSTATPITVAEKVAEPVQPVAQASEKQ